ncbi:hypothetical protein KIN20_024637 [Parelaphostrongylus tenuis]|uniref:Uncharacterized protein n=1 Tax=Parelaphostrongylus tenuis TaxID=148309 RepID=A0AAD5NA48_PARTN|nr:hypothetical protein KIN20_024637 [Parelaphostrongylus tenuis]
MSNLSSTTFHIHSENIAASVIMATFWVINQCNNTLYPEKLSDEVRRLQDCLSLA